MSSPDMGQAESTATSSASPFQPALHATHSRETAPLKQQLCRGGGRPSLDTAARTQRATVMMSREQMADLALVCDVWQMTLSTLMWGVVSDWLRVAGSEWAESGERAGCMRMAARGLTESESGRAWLRELVAGLE